MTLRQKLGTAIAGLAVVAACSSGPSATEAGPGGSNPVGSSSTASSETPGSDAPGGSTPTSAAPSPGSQATDPDPPSSVAPAPVPSGVGGFAGFYLRPGESDRLVIEVRHTADARPSNSTVEHVRATLASVSAKSVMVDMSSISAPSQSWTSAQLRSLADEHGASQTRDEARIRLLYLPGDSAEGSTVIGIAVRSDVAAVFMDKVESATTPVLGGDLIARAVSTHELGHLLGLVDIVIDTGREDPDHPGHSQNEGSVMYWKVETSFLADLLGGVPDDFDAQDRADLTAIRTS